MNEIKFVKTDELLERYKNQLSVFENLLYVFEVNKNAIEKVRKELYIIENELLNRGIKLEQ